MEEGAVGWSWRGSNGAVGWSSLLSSLAAAPWAALQVLLHTVDPLWDRARRAAPAVPPSLDRQRFQHGVASLPARSHPPTQVDGARSLPL